MPKIIPLSAGFSATVDDEDFGWLCQWKWSYDGHGYAVRHVGQGKEQVEKTLFMHRVILGAVDGKEVDHVNGDGLDNRRINLRLATRSQNLSNRRHFANAKSKYKGVRFDVRKGKWRLQFGRYFETEEEAARAYDRIARLMSAEFAGVNFEY